MRTEANLQPVHGSSDSLLGDKLLENQVDRRGKDSAGLWQRC